MNKCLKNGNLELHIILPSSHWLTKHNSAITAVTGDFPFAPSVCFVVFAILQVKALILQTLMNMNSSTEANYITHIGKTMHMHNHLLDRVKYCR